MMRSFLGMFVVLCFAVTVLALPPRPRFDTEALCQNFRNKCEIKNEQKNCKERAEECVKYAENGLNVTWSFCMYSNNDDLSVCNERIKVDYAIIEEQIRKGTFEYVADN